MITTVVSDHIRITPSTDKYLWKRIRLHISLLVFPYLGNLLITITAKSHSSHTVTYLQSFWRMMSGGYPHLRLFVSQCYKSRTVNHDTISTHSILFHSQHLQLRKVYPISLSTKHSPCILKVLLSFVTSVRSLTFSPKHSPTQANDPNTISVRFGRSMGHFTNGVLLEIETVITSAKHSAPNSICSRAVRSMFHSFSAH